jgi:hypothetical protein
MAISSDIFGGRLDYLRMSEAEYRHREEMARYQALSGLGAAGIGQMGQRQMSNPIPNVSNPTEPEFNLVLLTGDDDEA